MAAALFGTHIGFALRDELVVNVQLASASGTWGKKKAQAYPAIEMDLH
jgi:hypothetical protein